MVSDCDRVSRANHSAADQCFVFRYKALCCQTTIEGIGQLDRQLLTIRNDGDADFRG